MFGFMCTWTDLWSHPHTHFISFHQTGEQHMGSQDIFIPQWDRTLYQIYVIIWIFRLTSRKEHKNCNEPAFSWSMCMAQLWPIRCCSNLAVSLAPHEVDIGVGWLNKHAALVWVKTDTSTTGYGRLLSWKPLAEIDTQYVGEFLLLANRFNWIQKWDAKLFGIHDDDWGNSKSWNLRDRCWANGCVWSVQISTNSIHLFDVKQ